MINRLIKKNGSISKFSTSFKNDFYKLLNCDKDSDYLTIRNNYYE